jgi:hypothetical protein
MDKRETSKRPTPEAGGTRMFSPSFFGCANRGLRIEAPAPEEAAAPRSAGTTVDQLNGVWNSEWERSNPFGPAAPAHESRLHKAISRLQQHGVFARRAPSDATPLLRSLPA